MRRNLRRREFLRAGAAVAASGIAGCFQGSGDDSEDTPSPTPQPKAMQPIEAANASVFQSTRPIEHRIHELINQARTTRGIEAMSYDPNLAYLGRAHAKDMAERDFFSHTNPDGESQGERMINYGIQDRFASYSENIAKRPLLDSTDETDTVARKFFEMWKNSEGHWSNILEEDFDRHGVGVYIAEGGPMYAASEFAEAKDYDY